VRVEDWGRLGYQLALTRQLELVEAVQSGEADCLVLVEHDPVLTLGANFHAENLLLDSAEYEARGIDVMPTDRGGDVTYHGPGQLVMYPLFDLRRHGQDLHRWMRDLEETQLEILRQFGIEGRRFPPHTGAWVGDAKVSAIGVKVKRWVSMHGIAMNVESIPDAFADIVPCGIQGYGVTSLTTLLGRSVSLSEVKPIAIEAFRTVFGAKS